MTPPDACIAVGYALRGWQHTAGRAVMGLVVTAIAGCAVGPDPDRPEVGVDLDSPYAHASTTQPATQPAEVEIAGWWRRFGDETTNDLVAQAVTGNPDLAAAAARVVEARALLTQAFASRLPTVNLEPSYSLREQALTLPGGFAGEGSESDENVRVRFQTTSYDINLAAAWQVDLWGQLKRAQQAARYDFLATTAEQRALLHTVVAETIRARVAVATLQSRLELAQDNLESLRETLEVTDSRYRAGVGDAVSLRLARENVASSEAQIPPVERDLALALHALAVLLGNRPGTLELTEQTLPPVPDLAAPPVGLPVALLDQRPDVLASDFRSRAAQARIGVAVADLLPNLRLTGGVGLSSTEAADLFDGDSVVWNVLVSAVQPLFDGGSRRAGVTAARARAEAATADYLGTILTAIQDVEDALVRERAARAEAEASERALTEATAAETLARDRYRQGIGGVLDLFEAERRRRSAEERLTLSRQQVWNARIDLHLALGGDWDLHESFSRADDVAGEVVNEQP